MATTQSCIWIATDQSVQQVSTTTNQVIRTIPLTKVRALGMNGTDCSVWVLTDTKLLRYDANGNLQAQTVLSALNTRLKDVKRLVVDPRDQSVWIADEDDVARVSSTGQLIGIAKVASKVNAMSLAQDQTLWVLSKQSAFQYDRQARLLKTVSIAGSDDETTDIAVDSQRSFLWILRENQITRLDLSTNAQPPLQIKFAKEAEALAINLAANAIWVSTEQALIAYNSSGGLIKRVDLKPRNIKEVKIVAVDSASQSLWLASEKNLHRFTAAGDFVASLPRDREIIAIATPAQTLVQPSIQLIQPLAGAVMTDARPTIRYALGATSNGEPTPVSPVDLAAYQLNVKVNGQPVANLFSIDPLTGIATYRPAAPLPDGLITLEAQVTDRNGQSSPLLSTTFSIDTVAPRFLSVTPLDGSYFARAAVTLSGSVDDSQASVFLNSLATWNGTGANPSVGTFSYQLQLNPGVNTFNLTATDRAGNISNLSLSVNYIPLTLTVAPEIIDATVSTSRVAVSGTFAGPPGVAVGVNGASATITGNTYFVPDVPLQLGANSISIVATAPDGTSITKTINIERVAGGNLPPDPSTVAPPIPPNTAGYLGQINAFLYSGPNPIQTGVAPGTIEIRRAAVLRGRVTSRDKQPLSGVKISVLSHPEFGQTLSRADGMFDLAVNGGGILVVQYEKSGYISAQRQVEAPWQDYAWVDNVVLIEYDSAVTTVDLTASIPMLVAQGSVVNDSDGVRRATIFIPQGTSASLVFSDGSIQPITSLAVRATEYTAGPNGFDAMPAALPPTSAYTYCVELSADEAVTAGAVQISFSREFPLFIENFLNFRVGAQIPVGYLDRRLGVWIPSKNGRVIKILSVTAGLADLDVDGTNTIATPAKLATLGIGDPEREELARRYTVGQTLWRSLINHFTPWDCNVPWGPPRDAIEPPVDVPKDDETDDEDDPCEAGGSIIEIQNQVLGERINIAGTPFSLNYRSDRVFHSVFGRRSFAIGISPANIPPTLTGIVLVIQVAGQRIEKRFPAAPNQSFTFEWDGLDAYGRPYIGRSTAEVSVGYEYDVFYNDAISIFAAVGTIEVGTARRVATIWKSRELKIATISDNWDARVVGLGGWTLSAHHTYGSNGDHALHLGGGAQISPTIISRVISKFSSLDEAKGVAIAPNGDLYVGGGNRVYRIDTDGVASVFAGDGTLGHGGDGGPALQASLYDVWGIAIDKMGNVFIADRDAGGFNQGRIRKVTPNGIISTFAGGGGQIADGALATSWGFGEIRSIAVDAFGSVFASDMARHRILRISPEGRVYTIAGTGRFPGYAGDGGQATKAVLNTPWHLAVTSDGSLFFTDFQNGLIRKIGPDGTISTFAGGGFLPMSSDGVPAASLNIGFAGPITFDAIGNFYFYSTGRIKKVDRLGLATTAIGGGVGGTENNLPVLSANLNNVFGIAVNPEGKIFFSGPGINSLRGASASLPQGTANVFKVASGDGSEIYEFDGASARHTRTLHGRTAGLLYEFTYENHGYLSAITDSDGNRTAIERDASGRPQAIVSPYGVRTTLALNSGGYLERVSDPVGNARLMTYIAGAGLLQSLKDPNGNTSRFTYDPDGRLIKDENAAGGFWGLQRSKSPDGKTYTVKMQSAMGRTTTDLVEHLPNSDSRWTDTFPDGTQSISLFGASAVNTLTSPDGTVTTRTMGPDPRFGMTSAYARETVIRLPSGLTSTTTVARTIDSINVGDPLSPLIESERITKNGKVTSTVYDAQSRQYSNSSPMGRQWTMRLDSFGRLELLQVTGFAAVEFNRDNQGRLSTITQRAGQEVRIMRFDYGPAGFIASRTDALGRSFEYRSDLAGQIIELVHPVGRLCQFRYDANGNAMSVTPPGRLAHGFSYSPVDLVTAYNPPTIGLPSSATQFTYNLDKDLTRITRPDGQSVDFTHEPNGRLASITTRSTTVTYGYAPAAGTLATIVDSGGVTMAYQYDGDLLVQEDYTGQIVGVLKWEYNNNFDVSRLTVNGDSVTYTYDDDQLLTSAGRLSIMRDAGHGLAVGTTLDRVTTTQTYNAFSEINTFISSVNDSQIFSLEFSRDSGGRIVEKVESVEGQMNRYVYEYDGAGRLARVVKNGAGVSQNSYDSNGNRLSASAASATYDDQDRLLQYGNKVYDYTLNGDLKSITAASQTTLFNYDVMGNLRRVNLPDGRVIDYLIDGRNRRIGKSINGTRIQAFLYQDELRPVAELDGSGVVVSRFVYAGSGNVPAYFVKSGLTYRIITDHLGSVRLVIDTMSGTIAQRVDYDEFGGVLQDTNPGFQPFGFAGGLYDRDTKLVRFGKRDYDPESGRWTTKDPIGFNGGDTNLFAYVGSNPSNFTDPNGEFLVPVAVGIAAFIGGYLSGDMAGGKVNDISNFIGDKKSADNLADYGKRVTGACLNGNAQACGAMENFERQRMQCIGGTLSAGSKMSNVPSGGPLGSQIRKSGIQVGKQR